MTSYRRALSRLVDFYCITSSFMRFCHTRSGLGNISTLWEELIRHSGLMVDLRQKQDGNRSIQPIPCPLAALFGSSPHAFRYMRIERHII
jgi:hypothetical protein